MKFYHWVGAILVGLMALFFATSKRSATQRSNRLQEEKVAVLAANKSDSLQKASALNKKIEKQQVKAKKAGARSDARIEDLKRRDKQSMADRISTFNKNL